MSKVIWITGLSGSGKTTLATLVTDSIKQSGTPVIMLDGDILRECFDIKSKLDSKVNCYIWMIDEDLKYFEDKKIKEWKGKICKMIS